MGDVVDRACDGFEEEIWDVGGTSRKWIVKDEVPPVRPLLGKLQ